MPRHRVGARLGHGVDHRAVDAAVLGVVAVGLDLELLDVLHAVALVRAAAALVGDVDAVDLILRHVAAGRAGLDRAGVAARAGHQRHETQPVAAVDRQALHLPLLHRPGQLRLLGVDQRRLALTVIVSATDASFSVKLRVAESPTASRMPSLRHVPKPAQLGKIL